MIVNRVVIRRMKMLDDKMKKLCATRDIIKSACPERDNTKVLRIKLAKARIKIKQLKAENMNLKSKVAR